MKQIKASDAFALALIRQYPNPDDKDVQTIIKSLPPHLQEVAKSIIESKWPKLHDNVILITNRGTMYGGKLVKLNYREVWLSNLLIYNKLGQVVCAPKSRNSRRFDRKKIAGIELKK